MISVTIATNSGRISVEGPKEFVLAINWDKARATAELFATFAPSAEMAIKLAIQQQYSAWKGMRQLYQRRNMC